MSARLAHVPSSPYSPYLSSPSRCTLATPAPIAHRTLAPGPGMASCQTRAAKREPGARMREYADRSTFVGVATLNSVGTRLATPAPIIRLADATPMVHRM